MFPSVLAQAAPVIVTQDAAFSWPIVIFLLGLAAAVGESRWRVARLEKDAEEAERRHADFEKRAASTEQQVAVMASTLGRIEKGQENMERMLREALSTRSP